MTHPSDERSLFESEERFRLLVDGVTDHAIYMLDCGGHVASWNNGAERLKGYTADEILGRHYEVFFRREDVEAGAPVEELRQATERGRFEQEALRVRKDGSQFWAAIVLSPLYDPDGRLRGFAKVTRDISEQKRLRAAEAQMQSQLILSDRLRAIGTLAAGIAHEINNPLSYLISNLEVAAESIRELAGDAPPTRLRELTNVIRDAHDGANRVRRIVAGMKAFGRVEEDRRVALDVRNVLDMALKLTTNEIRHRARLVLDYGDTPEVEANEGSLVQVFVNLLLNAVQSFPEGTPDANEIGIATSEDAKGRVIVEIRDTGCGIPEETLGRIFEPFFTTKPVGEGTGLGLAICHGIVTGLGGEVTVRSEVGKGSAFRVALVAAASTKGKAARAPTRPTGEASAPRARILLVDDDLMVGRAIQRLLRGHDVTFLSDAAEAYRRLSAGERYDLVFCDVMMPGMSGMELYAALARLDPDQASRIVFVTGGAFTLEAKAFLRRVSNTVVEKPVRGEHLRELVRGIARRPVA